VAYSRLCNMHIATIDLSSHTSITTKISYAERQGAAAPHFFFPNLQNPFLLFDSCCCACWETAALRVELCFATALPAGLNERDVFLWLLVLRFEADVLNALLATGLVVDVADVTTAFLELPDSPQPGRCIGFSRRVCIRTS
jgi:hypothetical protein